MASALAELAAQRAELPSKAKGQPRSLSLVERFALAVGAAQDSSEGTGAAEDEWRLVNAFHLAVASDGLPATHDGSAAGAIPHRMWVHSRDAVPVGASLAEFIARHAGSIDAALLRTGHLGDMIELLYARNRGATGEARGDEQWEQSHRTQAGALLVALMFDFFAVWSPSRGRVPLKRKDYQRSRETAQTFMSAPEPAASTGDGTVADIAIRTRKLHVPIVRQAFVLSQWAGAAT